MNLYKELRKNNVHYRLTRLAEQYNELQALVGKGNEKSLIINLDKIYLIVQYIYIDYMESADKLYALDLKLNAGKNVIECRELQRQILEYLRYKRYIENLMESFKEAYQTYRKKRPFGEQGDAMQLIQWQHNFCEQEQKLATSCIKLADTFKTLETLTKPSEISMSDLYASPEVMRKIDCSYKENVEDAVYPFTHEISSNKEEKIQICKKCGSRIPSGRTFCARCGSPIQKGENNDLRMAVLYASPDMM